MKGILSRLQQNWVYGGFLASLVFLVLAPVLTQDWPVAELLVYLSLPVYMIHQLEEHDGDRFREFINRVIGHGHEVLTTPVVFVVNVLGVWGMTALSIWLTRMVAPGWGLIAAYLLLINAVLHIVQAAILRGYNPGLVTAVVLFLPLGAGIFAGLVPVSSVANHLVSIILVLALHGMIVLRVRQRLGQVSS
ncbi:HXXEE domain-containing protein [Roseibium litorale]|uniref:HXXEE domain-containing protein n=1 Tax=Roseibium litorale TaxID=2803841 RepID=A0ABR9CLS3_9HYPH|nr:HXXEE domain-containing protein [Roseibium litorale]MBD8891803.1 HXXEE domain-containing protein [Roseibium litorale]